MNGTNLAGVNAVFSVVRVTLCTGRAGRGVEFCVRELANCRRRACENVQKINPEQDGPFRTVYVALRLHQGKTFL